MLTAFQVPLFEVMKRNRLLCAFAILGVAFAALSALRTPLLPEAQLVLILATYGICRSFRFSVAAIVVCVLCTHHYAIPDAFFRIDGAEYPSIYTRSYGPVKILDILVTFLCLASITRIKAARHVLLSKGFPGFLFLLLFFGAASMPIEMQSGQNFLFIARSLALTLAIYLLISKLSVVDVQRLSALAIICWTAKMMFAILVPAEAPLYRDMFGFESNIYFAGDEYLSLGVYACAFACLSRAIGERGLDVAYTFPRWLFALLLLALACALVSQRKGAVSYFALLFIVLWADRVRWSGAIAVLSNVLVFSLPWVSSLFLLLVVPSLPDVGKAAFSEYFNLLESALLSLGSLADSRLHNLLFGMGPTGLYEIVGLATINDHETSFGKEVGEVYRYAIWGIPHGRLLLNVGIVGFLVCNLFLVRMMRSLPSYYYLYSAVLPLFYFGNITPPAALSYGIALVVLVRCMPVRDYKAAVTTSVNESRGATQFGVGGAAVSTSGFSIEGRVSVVMR